jgi:uncharacterized membrane protein YkgB
MRVKNAVKIERVGAALLRYELAGVITTIASLKFSEYEAKNIEPLVESSPLFAWLRRRIGMRRTAKLIGTTELAIAGLLAFAPRRSRLSVVGSVLAIGMFGTTLSFLLSTPAARTKSGAKGVTILSDVGQFLVKDVVLLGASVLTLGESCTSARSADLLVGGAQGAKSSRQASPTRIPSSSMAGTKRSPSSFAKRSRASSRDACMDNRGQSRSIRSPTMRSRGRLSAAIRRRAVSG